MKSIDKLWEVNLTFEESFPDFVSGEYFRFKGALSIFLKITFLYTNFPKHSKFKIHCKLKEIDNSSHDDGKYVLGFDFDMPRYENQVKLFDILLNHPLFNEISKLKPLFLHPQARSNNRQEFLMFRILLELINCKYFYNDQDPNRFRICFEIPFNIVTELDTYVGSQPGDQINKSNNDSNQYSPSKVCYNHKLLNLTFLRSAVKKNHFVWKPKPKKNDKVIHPSPNLNQMKNSKDLKRENSNSNNVASQSSSNNIPAVQEDKKNEYRNENEQEDAQLKRKIQGSNAANKSLNNEDPPALTPRKSLKRRESKQLNIVTKNNSGAKLDLTSEEIKSESSENDIAFPANLDHRKSHFSINCQFEENGSTASTSHLNKVGTVQKIPSNFLKLKSRDMDVFPNVLNYKLNELKSDKTSLLKEILMKDVLILLKQQAMSQHQNVNMMFKSEICIPQLREETHDSANFNKKTKTLIKFNSFSSIEELRKFDYQAYRAYIFNKYPDLELFNLNNLEFFKKIEDNGAPPLSNDIKPVFSSLFSQIQQKNFSSLQKLFLLN